MFASVVNSSSPEFVLTGAAVTVFILCWKKGNVWLCWVWGFVFVFYDTVMLVIGNVSSYI